MLFLCVYRSPERTPLGVQEVGKFLVREPMNKGINECRSLLIVSWVPWLSIPLVGREAGFKQVVRGWAACCDKVEIGAMVYLQGAREQDSNSATGHC